MLMLRRVEGTPHRMYHVLAGSVRIGLIEYHQEYPGETSRWTWHAGGFTGWGGHGAERGRVDTMDEALAAFRRAWERWVHAAGLIERAYPLDWPPEK